MESSKMDFIVGELGGRTESRLEVATQGGTQIDELLSLPFASFSFSFFLPMVVTYANNGLFAECRIHCTEAIE
jgi:hypothetical protein